MFVSHKCRKKSIKLRFFLFFNNNLAFNKKKRIEPTKPNTLAFFGENNNNIIILQNAEHDVYWSVYLQRQMIMTMRDESSTSKSKAPIINPASSPAVKKKTLSGCSSITQ